MTLDLTFLDGDVLVDGIIIREQRGAIRLRRYDVLQLVEFAAELWPEEVDALVSKVVEDARLDEPVVEPLTARVEKLEARVALAECAIGRAFVGGCAGKSRGGTFGTVSTVVRPDEGSGGDVHIVAGHIVNTGSGGTPPTFDDDDEGHDV